MSSGSRTTPIATSPTALMVKRIPVARYVCHDCGYLENWVENQHERDEIKRAWG